MKPVQKENSMNRLLTTGQVAHLCSVTPDTVLKWVKKNKLGAMKTAGGHYRISMESLEHFGEGTSSRPFSMADERDRDVIFCRDYHFESGNRCRRCIVFKYKSEICRRKASMKNAGKVSTISCSASCYDCRHFRHINKNIPDVLVVTENHELMRRLQNDSTGRLNLRFSCCGYETSAIIQDFRPDFIILDASLIFSNSNKICRHLVRDPRIHGSQIILAVTSVSKKRRLPNTVCAAIQLPFTVDELENCFGELQKGFFGKKQQVFKL